MNSPLTVDPGIGYVLAGAFALLFAQATLHKWQRVAEFRAVIANYRLAPRALEPVLALLIPALETGVAALLLPPQTRIIAAVVAMLLLAGYGAGIAINLGRGRRDVDCGCAGPADRRPIGGWMVWRNLLLVALLAALALPSADRGLEFADALTILGGIAVAALLYTAIDQLYAQVVPRGAALRGIR